MSEETKKYMENEKILAARLMKDKPEGMEGLRFVIEEIMLFRFRVRFSCSGVNLRRNGV